MTVTDTAPPILADPYAPDLIERGLALAALLLFAAVAVALFKGRADWNQASPLIWLHLATVMTPLALTPIQLLRRRGGRLHRLLGWIWAVLLFATAVVSFGIRDINSGGLSFIHIFSAVTVVTVPPLVLAARHHRIAAHRRSVRGIVTGALLIAGYFTLLPSRTLGGWLWG